MSEQPRNGTGEGYLVSVAEGNKEYTESEVMGRANQS